MYCKLSDYAKRFGTTYRTAWNRFKAGKLPGAYMDETRHVLVPLFYLNTKSDIRAAIYCRVSSSEMKENLERQKDRVYSYCLANGYKINNIITEVGSGMNDLRPKLQKLLTKNDDWDVLVVEHKDRLTRFGFNYIQTCLNLIGKELIVINNDNENEKKDLINDMVSILYSFTARIYGLRRAKNKREEILSAINS